MYALTGKSHRGEKVPVHSYSTTDTPAVMTSCSSGLCEAAAYSALVSPVGGMLFFVGGNTSPSNSVEEDAAGVNNQQQERQVPANYEREMVENQPPPIITQSP